MTASLDRIDVWRSGCKNSPCKYCNTLQWQDMHGVPSYMHLTKTARGRSVKNDIAIQQYKNACRLKNRIGAQVSDGGSSGMSSKLLGIPLEIRLMIYQYSLTYPPFNGSQVPSFGICAEAQGGRRHPEMPPSRTRLCLYARCAPNVSLLRVNRQIYTEVLKELYRQIPLTVQDASSSDVESGRLKYWLAKHPFKHVTEITFDRRNIPAYYYSFGSLRDSKPASVDKFLDFTFPTIKAFSATLNAMALRIAQFKINMSGLRWSAPSQMHNFLKWSRQTGELSSSLGTHIDVSILVVLDCDITGRLDNFEYVMNCVLHQYEKKGCWYDFVKREHSLVNNRSWCNSVKFERKLGLRTKPYIQPSERFADFEKRLRAEL